MMNFNRREPGANWLLSGCAVFYIGGQRVPARFLAAGDRGSGMEVGKGGGGAQMFSAETVMIQLR